MKRFFALFACSFILFACGEAYDDTQIRNEVNSLKDRVAKLEQICKDINSDVDALQAIVEALQDDVTVDSVVANDNGYTINFSDGQSVTITNGKDGADGSDGADGEDGSDGVDGEDGKDGVDGNTPVIGVKQDGGVYYWTVDGEWLLDAEGNKIKAEGKDGEDGKDGATGTVDGVIVPELKVEEGYWKVSTDGGITWEILCEVVDEEPESTCIFSNVEDGDNEVVFTLADGTTTITIPKSGRLTITLAAESCGLLAGQTCKVGYTVSNARGDVKIEVLSSADVKAKAVATSATEGNLEIICADVAAIDEYTKVVMLAADEARTAMVSLAFEKGEMTVVETNVAVAADATEAIIKLSNNLAESDYKVEIEEAATWVTYTPATRAMRVDELVFTLEPNTGDSAARTATITITAGELTQTAVIAQAASPDYFNPATTVKELIAWAEAQNADLATTDGTVVELAKCAKTLEAVIAMNNKGGNYYQMIALSDNTGEAGTGIAVYNKAVNDTADTKYPVGKKISVSLENLQVKNYGGMYEIVVGTGDFTATVSEEAAVEVKVPEITVAQLNDKSYMNMYVKVKDVKTTAAGTWVVGGQTTETTLVDAATAEEFVVRATNYAQFAGESFDAKSGSISGVVGSYKGTTNIQPQFSADVADFKAAAPEVTEAVAMTIPELVAVAKAAEDPTAKSVINAEKNVTFEGVVVTDKDGSNYANKTLALMTEGATDAENGIVLYGDGEINPKNAAYTFKPGDKVKVTLLANKAQITTYNGLREITGSGSCENWMAIEKNGTATVTPVEITADKLIDYQSMPVTLKNVTSPATAAAWSTRPVFTQDEVEFTVYSNSTATWLSENFKAAATGDITGIATVFNKGQLSPRSTADFTAFVGEATTPDEGGEGGEGGETTTPGEDGDTTAATYVLVTDATTLAAGDQIIIANIDGAVAMSTTQNGNNRGQAAITITENKITPTTDVQILTLAAGNIASTFAFNTGAGYLYAASSSKNYLRTEETLSDNSSWTIEIDNTGIATIKAQGTNTRNWMRYNSNNSIFSCYGSGQGDVYIFKKAE